MKVVLALRNKEIPPHLHFKNPNPYVPWKELPFTVPTVRTKWDAESAGPGRRIAGVSSFGLSGTNAHVVIELDLSTGRRGIFRAVTNADRA
jgi:acyl transferase domain-containing protein